MKLNYFNFKQYGKSILMTNDFGKYMFVSKEDFRKILALDVDKESELYESLIEKKMIYDELDLEYSSINKYALRGIKGHVNVATSLQDVYKRQVLQDAGESGLNCRSVSDTYNYIYRRMRGI